MEEKFLGFDEHVDAINERLERLEQPCSAGQAVVQEKSGQRATPATEAGGEEISQSEQ